MNKNCLIKLLFIIIFIGIFWILNFNSSYAVSIEKNEVDIYVIDELTEIEYSYLHIPDDFPQSYQIVVNGTDSKPAYTLDKENSIKIDENGLITPYYYNTKYSNRIGTYKSYNPGTTNVRLSVDGEELNLKVNVISYTAYYAKNIVDKYIEENITDDLTELQKYFKIVAYVAENYNYDSRYASMTSMVITGGGDCYASSATIVYMSKKVGINVRLRDAKIDNPGSNHRNAVALIDGLTYIGEAGYNEPKPRGYSVIKQEIPYTTSYLSEGAFLRQYDGFDSNIIVPDKVGDGYYSVYRIGELCFSKARSYLPNDIVSITLPSTITTIDDNAFSNCQELTTINIPKSVTSIGVTPFNYCKSLTNIKIDNPNYSIKNQVFYGDAGKTVIQVMPNYNGEIYTIPAGVTKIQKRAFNIAYTDIKNIIIPSSITTIDEEAFYASEIIGITIPSTVKTIEKDAFKNSTNLATVKIENGTTLIGDSAFSGCTKLTGIYIPQSVISISDTAFENDSNVVIYGVSGSYAESYANANNITFIANDINQITQSMVKSSGLVFYYNGKSQMPAITVYLGNSKLVEGTDYTVTCSEGESINSGTYTCLVTGIGKYTGEAKYTYYINAIEADFDFEIPDIDYGEEIKINIKNPNNINLSNPRYEKIGDTRYVYYSAPKDVGKYTCTIGTSNNQNYHYKSIEKTFEIRPVALKSISLTGNNMVSVNRTITLNVVYNPTNTSVEKIVEWSSSDESIATVTNGKVKGIKSGKATITAKVDGKIANFDVEVRVPVSSIYFYLNGNKVTSSTLFVNNPVNVKVEVYPENATNKDIKLTSSDTSIATINQNGVVTGKMAGNASIIAEADGIQRTLSLYVVDNYIKTVKFTGSYLTNSYSSSYFFMEKGKIQNTEVYIGGYYSSNSLSEPKDITYSSSDESIVTIDKNGKVTAINEGSATIYALASKSKNQVKGSCTVYVKKNVSYDNSNTQHNISNTGLPFYDVKTSDWFYNAVKYTYDNKIISGYNTTTFAPNDKLTRGMIVTILYRMEGAPNNNGKSNFSDVPSTQWYSKAIKWAVDNDIIHGYEGTNNFGPNDNIIRQDLAGILRNYASYKKKNISITADLTKFKDYKSVDKYANKAMQWAVGIGVITGNADGTLNPKGNATRAEAAAMIEKYCKKVGR